LYGDVKRFLLKPNVFKAFMHFSFNKERLSDPEILSQLLIGYPNFISSSLFSSLPMPGRKAVGFIILTFDLIRQGRNKSKVKFIYNILWGQRKHNLFCSAIGCYWYDGTVLWRLDILTIRPRKELKYVCMQFLFRRRLVWHHAGTNLRKERKERKKAHVFGVLP